MVEEWFGSPDTAPQVAVEFDEVRTEVGDGVAAVSAFTIFRGLNADGVEERSMNNRLTWILRRDGDGWKIVHEHTSAPAGEGGKVSLTASAGSRPRLGDRGADWAEPSENSGVSQCGMIEPLDRQLGDPFERAEERFALGLVDEDVELPAGSAQDVAGHECSPLPEKNTTCCGSPSSSIASTPARQLRRRRRLRPLAPRARGGTQTEAPKRSTKSAVPRSAPAA